MSDLRVHTKALVEGALCVALAVVLSKLDLISLPHGGSVDLELVPLLIFAWRRGLKFGLAAGLLTGVIKLILGAHIYYPAQALLDYPLAYTMAGLSGLSLIAFKPALSKFLATLIAALAQTAMHTISGAIFFAEYAPAGQNPWLYSIIANASLILPKYLISFIIAYFLFKALKRVMPN